MQQFDIDGPEILKLKLLLDELNENIDLQMRNSGVQISNCVNLLQNGINPLTSKIKNFLNIYNETRELYKINMNKLSNFMSSQISEYSISTQEAEDSVKELILYMEQSVDSLKGHIKVGTFTDTKAIRAGEVNYESIEKYINNEETLSVMNKCHDFFYEKGLSEEQIAGILGNICLESGFNVNAVNSDTSATGLFQFLVHQPSDNSLETQLEFAWEQMQGTPCGGNISSVVDALNSCNTVEGATNTFAIYFEGVGDGSGGVGSGDGRRNFAKAIYYYYSNVNN